MSFKYSKLLGRIKECDLTQRELATIIGISPSTLCLKLKNKGWFTADEIDRICQGLKIEKAEIPLYFFAD